MDTATNNINIARTFITECIKQGLVVNEAWLFGSSVNGTVTKYSDIDIALISDLFTLNFLQNNKFTALLNYKYPDIEIHHFNTDIFQKDDPFINEIKRTGIKIY